MKYVYDIITSTGTSVPQLLYDPGAVFSAKVHDTKTGRNTLVTSDNIERVKPIGVADIEDGHIVLCHDVKTAALYKHITVERKVDLKSIISSQQVDMCSIDVDDSVKYNLHGCKTLVIKILKVPSLSGLHGSVASLRYVFLGYSDHYSLYDFIDLLCKRSRLRLMQYNTVYVACGSDSAVGIKFNHSAEANRFFTKMLLDVTKV